MTIDKRHELIKTILKHLFFNALILLTISVFFFSYNAISGRALTLTVPTLIALVTPTIFFNILYNKYINTNANLVIEYFDEAILSKNYLEDIIKVIPSFVLVLDIDFKITSFNEQIQKASGYSDKELEQKKITDIIGCLNSKESLFTFFSSGPSTLETTLVTKEGDRKPILLSIVQLQLNNKLSYGYICAAQDISLLKSSRHSLPNSSAENQSHLQYMATHDHLTGLSNRFQFEMLCNETVEKAIRRNQITALYFIDIDDFKDINARYGHAVGDEILRHVAKRITQAARQSDCAMHDKLKFQVARTGGDEYVLLSTDLSSYANCSLIARRILNATSKAFTLRNHTIHLTVSIGISPAPYAGTNFDSLVKSAYIAMKEAKNSNTNKYQYFNDALNHKYERRLLLISRLNEAMKSHQLTLHYQPIFDLRSKEIQALEVLLRWPNPEIEQLEMEEIIHIAEETGLIIDIGYWVLNRTFSDYKKLFLHAKSKPLLAINLSPVQLNEEGFTTKIIAMIRDYQLTTSLIEFEITESSMMQENATILSNILELHELGFRLSIDDFGTGLSSLSRLQKLPINTLKIDKSFIFAIQSESEQHQIIDLILKMSQLLSIDVIGEGITNPSQLTYLLNKGCQYGQGFLLSEPLSLESLREKLKKGHVYKPKLL